MYLTNLLHSICIPTVKGKLRVQKFSFAVWKMTSISAQHKKGERKLVLRVLLTGVPSTFLILHSPFLLLFSSTINPILYNVMSHRYRIAFRETLCSRKRGFYSSTNGFVREQSSFRETTIAAAGRDSNLNSEGSKLVSHASPSVILSLSFHPRPHSFDRNLQYHRTEAHERIPEDWTVAFDGRKIITLNAVIQLR